jgi:hypothetical protein
VGTVFAFWFFVFADAADFAGTRADFAAAAFTDVDAVFDLIEADLPKSFPFPLGFAGALVLLGTVLLDAVLARAVGVRVAVIRDVFGAESAPRVPSRLCVAVDFPAFALARPALAFAVFVIFLTEDIRAHS